MDWESEPYRKLYMRDTATWLLWPWQARALLPLLLRKVDRTGALGLGRNAVAGLAALVGLPEEVAAAGLEALTADGTVVLDGQKLTIPNHTHAQNGRSSAAIRMRESRERKSAKTGRRQLHGVARSDTPLQPITIRSDQDRDQITSKDMSPAAADDAPPLLLPGLGQAEAANDDREAPRSGSQAKREPSAQAQACTAVLDHWAERFDRLRGKYDGLYGIVGKALKSFTVEELKLAVDGAALDDWWKRKQFCKLGQLLGTTEQIQYFIGIAKARRPKPPGPEPGRGPPPATREEYEALLRATEKEREEAKHP
jgi:hypothetical protein